MNILDVRTVLFSYVISNAICAIVMTFLWLQNRQRSPELGLWLADFVMQLLAVLLIALRGIVPDVVSILLGTPLVIGGTLLLYIGLERYVGKASSQRHNYVLLAVFIFVHAYFTFTQPSLLARNLNISLGLLVVCSQSAWLMLCRADEEMRPAAKAVGVSFAAYGLVSVARVFIDLTMPSGHDLFKSGLYDTLVILTYQMLFIGLTFALFLMVNRRLFAELEGDVLHRTLAEQALKQSEEKFSIAFHNIPDALAITSIRVGEIIEVNERFFQITEFTREDIMGKTTIDLNLWGSESDRNRFAEALQRHGRVLNHEANFRKKSGELFAGLISGELIQLQEEACILSVIRDITERKRQEEALRESEGRFREIFENISNGVVVYETVSGGEDFRIKHFNRAAEKIEGISRESVIGRTVCDAFPGVKEYGLFDILQRVWHTGNAEHCPLGFYQDDRIAGWRENYVAQLPSGEVVAVYSDVTERKRQDAELLATQTELRRLLAEADQSRRALLSVVEDQKTAEEEIRQLNAGLEQRVVERTAQLQASNKELEAFSYSVSHDLRAPLRAVIGFSSAVLEDYGGRLDGDGQHFLTTIRDEARKMGQLIDDLLSFSRIGRQPMCATPIEMTALVQTIVGEIIPEPERAVEIHVDPLPSAIGDPSMMRQVWTNLVSNASKFTRLNERAAIHVGGTETDKEWIYFVQDNGAGFDMRYADKLFGVFQRLHSDVDFEGTGIGLSIVQRVILRHGGRVWAEGQVNQGATFYFALPKGEQP